MSDSIRSIPMFLDGLRVAHDSFSSVEGALRQRDNVQPRPFFAATSEYQVGFDEGKRATAYEIELAAMVDDATEARWSLEIEYEYWSQRCFVNAEAGFLGKFGPMPVRELSPTEVPSLESLAAVVKSVVEQLFGELDSDMQKALLADKKEMEKFREQRNEH